MTGTRAGLVAAAGLALAGCGGSAGGAAEAETPAGIGIDLTYHVAATPRAGGFAAALAAALPASDPAPRPPSDTWLRVRVTGPGFEPIVCQFPRRTGGECGGIPAGAGRVVTVEEWDATFATLYFRGQVGGVAVAGGRSTRVQVSMHPPVVIQHPVADGGVNLPSFSAVVQAEPHAKVLLYLGHQLVGTQTADESGVAEIPVTGGGGTVPPRPDGKPGLPDGDYLLTAIALPPASAGASPVRHQGIAHAFAVDLVRPTLALSGPSLTSAEAVDLSGVTEPGVRLRCGRDRPADDVPVGPDGRFARPAFPLAGPATRIVCEATDRAGNVTTRDLVVAFLPHGFAIDASLPDVTRQATETLRVSTDPTVEDLTIDIVGELAQSTRQAIAGRQAEPGLFEVPLPLFENQWNQVRVNARIAGVVLGSVEVEVEHDGVAPALPNGSTAVVAPEPDLAFMDLSLEGDRLFYDRVVFVFRVSEPNLRVEVFNWDNPSAYGDLGTGGFLITNPPSGVLGVAEDGQLEVASGRCFSYLYARTIDRAGNLSPSWYLVALPPTALGARYSCVR